MHHEAKDSDPVWDCTLIKVMRSKGDTVVSPIYNWTDRDVWEYIRKEGITTNPMYECGYKRVGCIGCPLASYKGRLKEFTDYPKYKKMYLNAFGKMINVRKEKGLKNEWTTPEEVFDWWIEEGKHNIKGQMTIEDFIGKENQE